MTPTDETRALVDEINALVEAGTEEIERLRARVAELEEVHRTIQSEKHMSETDETDVIKYPHHDMHLRDLLAAKVIQGLLANPSGPIQVNGMSGWGWCNCTIEEVADLAWFIADHMLKARGGSDAG